MTPVAGGSTTLRLILRAVITLSLNLKIGVEKLFLIDGQAVWPNLNIQVWLLAILIELITHHGDDDDECADDEVDNVTSAHA
jgi:hypothetical protein